MTITEEMIEAAAKAMCKAADDDWDWSVFYIVDARDTAETGQNLYREMARSALTAALSAGENVDDAPVWQYRFWTIGKEHLKSEWRNGRAREEMWSPELAYEERRLYARPEVR